MWGGGCWVPVVVEYLDRLGIGSCQQQIGAHGEAGRELLDVRGGEVARAFEDAIRDGAVDPENLAEVVGGQPIIRPEELPGFDAGDGSGATDLAHVFERFCRGEKSRQRRELGGGTGLGLAISRAVVKAHHGTISITSVLGRGTTVRFTLPIGGHPKNHLGER